MTTTCPAPLTRPAAIHACQGAITRLTAYTMTGLDDSSLVQFIDELHKLRAATAAAEVFMGIEHNYTPTPEDVDALRDAFALFREHLQQRLTPGEWYSPENVDAAEREAVPADIADVDAFTGWLDAEFPATDCPGAD